MGSEAVPSAGSLRELEPSPATPALILGHSNSALGVMRVLGRRGIRAFIATPRGSFVAHSRWYRPCPNATEEFPAPGELDGFLESLPFEHAVLMPCSDDWVRAAGSLDPALRDRFHASLAGPATLGALLDKAHLATVLERLDVPHPATEVLSSPRDLDGIPDEVLRSAFLKPRDSLSFYERYGTKAFRIRDRTEARTRLADLEKAGQSVVLQERIPGSAEDHCFIEGFVDLHGEVCARFARRRVRMWPRDFGATAYTTSIPVEEVAAASENLDRLLKDLSYRGVFAAEFMHDRRTDEVKLLEVNVRPYGHIEFAAACGVDLCRMAYRDALGLPVEPVVDYEVGRRCHDLDRDLPAALELIRRGELSRLSWVRSYLGADGLVFAWDDPMPALHRLRSVVGRQLQAPSPANGWE